MERLKIGVVGASTLLGKEVAEEIGESALAAAEVVLLDEETAEGQLGTLADEIAMIQRLGPDSFAGCDFVFFAGEATQTRAHWREAVRAGALVLDVTGALEEEPETLSWSPWVRELKGGRPDLTTSAVVVLHPIAALLAQITERLREGGAAVRTVMATLLQPASEAGKAAMDELQQQTVHLLSFQDVPKEVFGTQAAFNVLPEYGVDGKVRLEGTERLIRGQFRRAVGENGPRLMLQVLGAPVFHGFGVSAFLVLEEEGRAQGAEALIASPLVALVGREEEGPTPLSVAAQRQAMVRVEAEAGGLRLWLVADNLKMLAAEAVGAALALRRVHPHGRVQ